MKKRYIAALAGFVIMAASGQAIAEGNEGKQGPRGGKMFEEIDANGDGAISKAESQAFHAKRFDEVDTNGDGSISKEEGKAAHEARRAKRGSRK